MQMLSCELVVARGVARVIARGAKDISDGSTKRKIKSEQPETLRPRPISMNLDR